MSLYFKDDAGHADQLTVTEPREGAGDAVWQGDRIVAVVDRGFRNGLELRDLSTPATEIGKRLGEGVSPAVSPSRTLAYVRIGERKGKLVDLIVRRRGDRRRVVGQGHLVQQPDWISRHRLVALVESRSGSFALVDITGRHRGRTVPLRGRREGLAVISAKRRVAYSFGRAGARRVAVMRLRHSPPRLPPRMVPADLVAGRPSHPRRQPLTRRADEPT